MFYHVGCRDSGRHSNGLKSIAIVIETGSWKRKGTETETETERGTGS